MAPAFRPGGKFVHGAATSNDHSNYTCDRDRESGEEAATHEASSTTFAREALQQPNEKYCCGHYWDCKAEGEVNRARTALCSALHHFS